MSEWQSIEAAPKDGTRILIHFGPRKEWPERPAFTSIFWWDEDHWDDGRDGFMNRFFIRSDDARDPLGWMPLPTPPAGSEDCPTSPNVWAGDFVKDWKPTEG